MTGSPAASLLVAGLLLAAAAWSYVRASRMRRWPVVRAAVDDWSESGRQRILAGQPTTAHVEYAVSARYSAAGREHRARFHLLSPPGDHVELRYNPLDPGDFVVGTQSRWPALLLLAMSLLLLADGVAR